MTFENLDCWQKTSVAADALRLREQSREAARPIAGLVRLTESRKVKLAVLVYSLLHFLFPI